jgi:hypothetical protein
MRLKASRLRQAKKRAANRDLGLRLTAIAGTADMNGRVASANSVERSPPRREPIRAIE